MKNTLQFEVDKAKTSRIGMTVQDMIVPALLRDFAKHSANILGRETMVDEENKQEVTEALDALIVAYVEETISQLKAGVVNLKS